MKNKISIDKFNYKFIISKTPYRISLGGGGTDLPFYSDLRGGELITGAINQYCLVLLAKRPLDKKIMVQTTETQITDSLNEVENFIVRETLRYFRINNSIHVSSFTTIPTGIGLGTSSTFIVGIIKCISDLINKKYDKMKIAKLAHIIERKILQIDGGIQDQYISSLGGIQLLKVSKKGTVTAKEIRIKKNILKDLQRHLVLVYSGQRRESKTIIKAQKHNLNSNIKIYDQIKEIGKNSKKLLINGDIDGLGKLMDDHWKLKLKLANEISDRNLNNTYGQLKKLGSPGGKIIGAGGGGFFMMAVPHNVEKYISNVKKLGFRYMLWKFDFDGSSIIKH
ncbi:MAG: D-glycero-alpha-D-manno-heptose 7-phosphate kinase [Alphaproteobacteria bacterium MarineAlpha5_Bin11]|nr:hypothetical protein [Pelagibacteraceae bacterium]PPR43981.1 MAG: D-glycero-alpha-D-manno-heptose 7-phosphate kinase [Alphaproteobacteria bacterium MarineAlpha5_Bin11]PPR51268.1 MAG: D-glycero-alpha-D-manno-heptose 7-phosphate kinase [Alphaproteobacteria bacterium MarineAlpha5_Bin10]|tara:strand:+ start:243 stop:1253 length:1011 start_codon:yes stop_codon:yes gene_type:complete